MPRIDLDNFDDRDEDTIIRIKTPKPRNPHVRELFDGGQYAPKVEKNKKKESKYRDKRNWDQV